MKTLLFVVVLVMASTAQAEGRPTVYTEDKPVIELESWEIDISRVNLSPSGEVTEIHVQTGRRGILHCEAFDIDGTFIGSTDSLIEKRHNTLHIQTGKTDTVECSWNQ